MQSALYAYQHINNLAQHAPKSLNPLLFTFVAGLLAHEKCGIRFLIVIIIIIFIVLRLMIVASTLVPITLFSFNTQILQSSAQVKLSI